MRYLIPFLLLANLVWLEPTLANDVVRIRVSHYPPIYYQSPQGEWIGIEIEVVKAICKQAGLTPQFLELPWSRALEYLESGKLDLIMALTRTPERERFIDYIGVSRYEQMVLIVKKENIDLEIRTLDDLTKYPAQFGVQYKTEYPALTARLSVDKAFAEHFDFVTDQNMNLRKMSMDRILGFFEDKHYAIYAIKHIPEYRDFAVHSFALSEPQPVYLGASRKMTRSVRDRLKEAYRQLSGQGVFEAIWKTWEAQN